MNSPSPNTGRLSTIDLAFSIMDNQRRPLDFTLLFHLTEAPGLEALRAGASSARNFFPATGSYIEKQHWVRFAEPSDGVTAVSVSSTEELTNTIEAFLQSPFDLHLHMPVRQLVITNPINAEVKLVTRFHHAAADGLSAAMWLSHQLRVAQAKEAPAAWVSPFQNLALRTYAAAIRRSRFAYRGGSDRLWTRSSRASRARRWRTIEVAATDLRRGCRRTGGFTYNDLLATCALEVFTQWNGRHCQDRKHKIGLWLPVGVRRDSSTGFGNGTSRIRVYARYDDRASLVEKCREVRRQISWSNRHGEWAVPAEPPLAYLPHWAVAPLLRCYFNRPGVDMSTGVFSHAERWTGESSEIFERAEKVESIAQLHPHHSVAITGATHRGRTWLTFTYDPGLLSAEDIQQLVEMYQEQVAVARREFA